MKPPERTAVSAMVPPRATGPEAWVTMVGCATETTTDSAGSPQLEKEALLLSSPL